jgi:formylglycine-generating enzyme required for sulfatase activity
VKFVILILTFSSLCWGKEVKIPQSIYTPVFKEPGEVDTVVGPLLVDETPVTNQEFLRFVKSNPQFMKSKVAELFAGDGYLSHWTGDTEFKKSEAQFPVTHVSWFVARKYCASLGKRLPTIAEWEVASDSQNPDLEKKILEWYAKPGTKLKPVGQESGNKFGVKNAHGLVWEWVDNFAETIMSGDSRGGSSTESLFCGGAALKGKDPKLYATFMRFAFRSSLSAKYDSPILGFRCVRELKGVKGSI